MKRKRGRGDGEFLANRARAHAPRSSLHQQSEYGQPRFMPQGSQASRGDISFHVSSIVEIITAVNRFHEKVAFNVARLGSVMHSWYIALANATLPVMLRVSGAMYNGRALA